MEKVKIIGAGLAGCEAAWTLAQRGIEVELYEMKPEYKSAAHSSDLFAELVCSNSLKAARINSAAGLLKEEMRRIGSICMEAAEKCQVPAGGALAVDREIFSSIITEKISNCKNITVKHERVDSVPRDGIVIVATGPLTDGALAEDIAKLCSANYLNFYDAAAPIVTADSIDTDIAFRASRYGKGEDDYINCPFSKSEYEEFHKELVSAEVAEIHEFDKPVTVYEGCMPIEILASRGLDAARYGPMKPVGLINPKTGHRPWAAVQLRAENREARLYNLVGFQTNLKWSEQKRVFSMIPGLKNAEFVRYGVMHRNSFINSPRLLNSDYSLREHPNISVCGQLSGVEGYMESASSGIAAALAVARKLLGKEPIHFPNFTMLGALSKYISDETVTKFQPMGANFGVLPPLAEKIKDKSERYSALSARSLSWFDENAENFKR